MMTQGLSLHAEKRSLRPQNRFRSLSVAVFTGILLLTEAVSAEPGASIPDRTEQAKAFQAVILVDNTESASAFAQRCQQEIQDVCGVGGTDTQARRVQVTQRTADPSTENARTLLEELEKDPGVSAIVAVGPFSSLAAMERSNPKKWLLAILPPANPEQETSSASQKRIAVTWENSPLLAETAARIPLPSVWLFPVPAELLSGDAEGRITLPIPGVPENITARRVDSNGEPDAIAETARQANAAIALHPWSALSPDATENLLREAANRKVPVISCRTPADAELGALAALCGEDAPRALARRTANIIARLALEGAVPESLRKPIPFPAQLTLNVETARTLGLPLREDMLRETTLIAEEPTCPHQEYSLPSTARTAVEGNLDLSAEQRKVRASSWNIPMARANFLPQVDLSSTFVAVDEELANVANPERTWSASLKVTQLLYDEMARANLSIQKRLQAAAEQAYAGQELDIIALAAESYINVQLARTLQRVQRENLRQVRTYLDLARRRHELGTGPLADVHRWEAALAQARIELAEADKARLAANWQFNRVLNRDQDETFRIIDQPAETPELLTGPDGLTGLMLDRSLFDPLCSALARRALEEAPELRQLDELIAAQGKACVALRRRYFMPTIGFQTEFRNKLDTSGKYAETGGLQSLFIPGYPENAWTFGLNATLPLYAGGKRRAEEAQNRDQLEQLKLTRRAAAQKLEQRARMAAAQARASLIAMDESRRAAEAARKNLRLVESGYERGLLGIAQFVDAQTASHVAELGAAAAEHQFIRDVIGLHRALGVMFFLEPEENRREWLQKLRASLDGCETGGSPDPGNDGNASPPSGE